MELVLKIIEMKKLDQKILRQMSTFSPLKKTMHVADYLEHHFLGLILIHVLDMSISLNKYRDHQYNKENKINK